MKFSDQLLVPAVELAILLWLGGIMGPMATMLLILITGVAGASLARREGLGILTRLAGEVRGGTLPAEAMLEATLVVGGGLLLLTPGVLTDLVGFFAVFGPTRRMLLPPLRTWIKGKVRYTSGVEPKPEPLSDPDKGYFKHPTK